MIKIYSTEFNQAQIILDEIEIVLWSQLFKFQAIWLACWVHIDFLEPTITGESFFGTLSKWSKKCLRNDYA